MQQKLNTARVIIGFLVAALIICAVVIWNNNQTIAKLEAPGKQNISAQADVIRTDCSASDADSQARCADDLQQLSDLLAKFSKTMHSGTTTPVSGAVSNIQIDKLPK